MSSSPQEVQDKEVQAGGESWEEKALYKSSVKQLLGNKNFRNCFPFGDKLGSLDVECLAGEAPGALGAAGPGASNGFGASEAFLTLLVAVTRCHSRVTHPMCSRCSLSLLQGVSTNGSRFVSHLAWRILQAQLSQHLAGMRNKLQ